MNRETGRMISLMGCGVIAMVIACFILVFTAQIASAREPETPPGFRLGIGGTVRGGPALSASYAVEKGELGLIVLDRADYSAAIGYAVFPAGNLRLGIGWADRLTPRLGSRLNFAIGYDLRIDSTVSLRWLHFSNGSIFFPTPNTTEHPNIGEDVLVVSISF